ncbi:glycosyl transferase [Eubacterium sp. MSJ-33]|nr:glycosyl transferase [Eubacterium sp. MSJ-33]
MGRKDTYELEIPKKIHYCWFGGNPLGKTELKCIESWKRYFPDYEIIEWNESNYDVNSCDYIKEAYENKKWAFVSDFARFDILYQYGGVYFDTDVEVIKSFNDILKYGSFMGCEIDGGNDNTKIAVNPGLGIAAHGGHSIYREFLELYEMRHFCDASGSIDTTTVVEYMTNLLVKHGLKNDKGIQEIEGIKIYPKEYFNPYDSRTGEIHCTDRTYSIHHYTASWTTKRNKVNTKIVQTFNRLIKKK